MEKSRLSRIEILSEITRHRKTSGVGLSASVCAGVTADVSTGVAVDAVTIKSVGVIDGIGVSVDVIASASIGVGFDAKGGLGVVAGAGSSAVGSFDSAVEVDQIAPTMSLAYRTGKHLFSLDTGGSDA